MSAFSVATLSSSGEAVKAPHTRYLLAASLFATIATTVAFAQTDAAVVPFSLEISATWKPGYVGVWDFTNTAEKVVKAGSGVVIGIRKINRTDHEIARLTETGGPYGYVYDVRDRDGNPVRTKSPYDRGWIRSGGPGRVRGSKDMVLEPGEGYVSSAPISNWYDLSQPGKYTIQVSEHVSDDPRSDVIRSNVITVDIVPSDTVTPTQ